MKRTSNGLILACALLFGSVAAFGSTASTSWGKVKKEVQADTQPAAKKTGGKDKKGLKEDHEGGNQVDICHFDEDSGFFRVISISSNAVDKHIANHGDSLPGTYFVDQDGDGFGDPSTTDACSNPGFVANGDDAFPTDASEHADSDGDGVGDNSDPTPNGEPVFGFVEFDFGNVGITTGPCPDCVLSAPASSSDGPIASASFEWTDTDGISPGCGWSVHGVLDWGSNMFVGRGLGDPSTYGGEYYYLDLDVSAEVQLTNISLLVGNNGFYTNLVYVVAFQAGQETVLGTFNLPGAASPAANTPPNVTVAIAGQLDPGPAEIRLKVQGALYSPSSPCG